VWMGTRFIASVEAHAGQAYKNAIVAMTESDTVISRAFTGKTLRAIANDTTREWANKEPLPFMAQVANSARNNLLGPIAGVVDDVNPATQCLAAGQGGGAITEILTCAEIVARTMAEAEATTTRLGRL
jgi:enoyl-[acyl-carrier protein] reductase II